VVQGSSALKTFGADTVRGTFREAPKQLARTVGFVKGSIGNVKTNAGKAGMKTVLAPTTRDDWSLAVTLRTLQGLARCPFLPRSVRCWTRRSAEWWILTRRSGTQA
jgi:hypothetical protein